MTEEDDEETLYSCEGQVLSISCGEKVAKIVRANFGRFSIAVCNDQVKTNLSVNCFAPDTLTILEEKCNYRHSCQVDSAVETFGADPCPETAKYLEVHYVCVEQRDESPPLPNSLASTALRSQSSSAIQKRNFRVPITAKPSQAPAVAQTSAESSRRQESSYKKISLSDLSQKFTLPSTNIMDTSEAPIKVSSTTPTTTSSTPSSPTTMRTTTTSTTGGKTDEEPDMSSITTTVFMPAPIHIYKAKLEEFDFGPRPGEKSCGSRLVRTLEWPETRAGSDAVLTCPLGAQGRAFWSCQSRDGDEVPRWNRSFPDLSNCKSIWLTKILEQLRRKVSLVHLAKETAHYATFNPLYGGDVTSLIDVIGAMVEKMTFELEEIPTKRQREAVVMEIVQSAAKTASIMLDEANLAAWLDLNEDKRARSVTRLTETIKSAAALLPKAVGENQEITVATTNLCKLLLFFNVL